MCSDAHSITLNETCLHIHYVTTRKDSFRNGDQPSEYIYVKLNTGSMTNTPKRASIVLDSHISK